MDHQPDTNSAPPSTVDDALTATAVGFGIGGAALAPAVPPAAVALGVAAGGVQLVQLVQRKWGKRPSQVAYGARERLGDEEADAARKLTEDEDLAALAFQALDASMLSHHEEQARALGRVLGEALKAEPTITIDEAAMVIEALRFPDLPHLRTLQVIDQLGSLPTTGLTEHVSTQIGTSDPAVLSGLLTGLQRAGLAEPSAGFIRSLGGLSEARWYVTAFGRRVLN